MALAERKSANRGECRTAGEPSNCAVERQAHVEEEMQYLNDTLSNLEVAQQSLFNRIAAIIAVADAEPCKERDVSPARYVVPHAERIRSLRYRVDALFDSTQSVTRRVEL